MRDAIRRSLTELLASQIQLRTRSDGRYVLANVANGDGGEFAQFLRMPSGKWIQLTTFADKVVFATFGEDCLYPLSRHEAPRGKIVRLTCKTIRCRAFPRPLPPVASIVEMGSNGADGLLYKTSTFIAAPRWYEQPAGGKSSGAPTVNVYLSVGVDGPEWTGVEIVRETAVSRDGTRVPLNISKRTSVSYLSHVNVSPTRIVLGESMANHSRAIVLSDADRVSLERLQRSTSGPSALSRRARVVLLLAEAVTGAEVARGTGYTVPSQSAGSALRRRGAGRLGRQAAVWTSAHHLGAHPRRRARR